ncbi:MAG: hypothetical protein FVQ81_18390, partial [Candidatus Glassbacteria bacterium]|nr:hypothetical protein [Candidatus Glassbacteria bacterium]
MIPDATTLPATAVNSTQATLNGTVNPKGLSAKYWLEWWRAADQVRGAALWLDASAITGLEDGDPVATWVDQSGQGNDVTQPIESRRPEYKVNVLNELPAVRFDGATEYLRTSAQVDMSSGMTIIAVGKNRIRRSYNGWVKVTNQDSL